MDGLSIANRMIENRTFQELAVGDSASSSKTITQQDIDLFAIVTGDINPAHMDPEYAATDMFTMSLPMAFWVPA
jgi:phosphate acetyltransferase